MKIDDVGDLEQAVGQYHRACDEFSRGDPKTIKGLYARKSDVSLANPFGPPVVGWEGVAAALDYASSRFRDGDARRFERLATYETVDLATILEVEEWHSRVGERVSVEPFTLRVTTTFRRENGDWRLVHRHADPIMTTDEGGPLRRG